jgi:hypothetical protein
LELDVVRGDVSVASGTGVGYVQLGAFAVAAGDEVTLRDVDTGVSYVATLTGAPTLAVAQCGASKFVGTRDEGATVSIRAGAVGGAVVAPAVVGSDAGTTFAGGITTPLTSAWTLTASQKRVVSGDFTVYSDVGVSVTDCPAPPPVAVAAVVPVAVPADVPVAVVATPAPAPGRDVLAPLATLKLRLTNAYKSLVRGTFADAVTITEPGTVSQKLYADKAFLGSGHATAGKPGAVNVKLKLTKTGKSHISRRKAIAVKLTTTVTDPSGNTRVLKPKHFTLRRGR